MPKLRLALAQINTIVGDFDYNAQKIITNIERAKEFGADIITFPELAICGYPPEDLLLKPHFINQNLSYLEKIKFHCKNIVAIIGFVDIKNDIFNAAGVIFDQNVVGIYHKIYLPNYGVFDENRYFRPGDQCQIYIVNGIRVGISICEDIWYEIGPPTIEALSGAELLINISASPYHKGKVENREEMLRARAYNNIAIIAYNNLVGGQDELVFDGNSTIINEKGIIIAHAKPFHEEIVLADIDTDSILNARLHDPRWRKFENKSNWVISQIEVTKQNFVNTVKPELNNLPLPRKLSTEEEIYQALVLGTKDYVLKNGFRKVVIGLSGGIDSSLVATIATDALGAENVLGVMMPSRYTSKQSISDASLLAHNLNIKLISIPIDSIFQQYLEILKTYLNNSFKDSTEENIQARIRGNILMALSNKFGWLVLTTGNKSEMATGYATLYGDMAGGFAVIKDVFKTTVYSLTQYRNSISTNPIIPLSIINREPTAELRPDQKDTDVLPPYNILDPILKFYVEDDLSAEQILSMGYPLDTVKKVIMMVDRSEYKRRQSPLGIKITPRAFGKDRRLPVTNRYREV